MREECKDKVKELTLNLHMEWDLIIPLFPLVMKYMCVSLVTHPTIDTTWDMMQPITFSAMVVIIRGKVAEELIECWIEQAMHTKKKSHKIKLDCYDLIKLQSWLYKWVFQFQSNKLSWAEPHMGVIWISLVNIKDSKSFFAQREFEVANVCAKCLNGNKINFVTI